MTAAPRPIKPRAAAASGEQQTTHSLTMLKGLSILEYIAAHSEPLAVGEVAAALRIEKSSVSRLLASLRTAGYVRQGRDRRYQLTSKLLFLTRNFAPAEHLREVARHTALSLHREFDEAVHVASIDHGEIVFVDYLESPLAVRIQLPTVPAPMHLTAIGRAALAAMPADVRGHALSHSLKVSGQVLSGSEVGELNTSLLETTRRGYCVYSPGDDVTRVAIAILNESGEPVGGISVSGPSYRIEARIPAIGRALASSVADLRG